MSTEEMPGRPVVTLDLWLTLIAELDGTQRSQKRYETRAQLASNVLEGFGLTAADDRLLEASREISHVVTADHDLGIDLVFIDRVAQMLSFVDDDLPGRLTGPGLPAVAAAVDRAFLDNPPSFLPQAKDVLRQLRNFDVNVALISNTGLTSASAYREWFDAEGILDCFDVLTFSNEIGCAKPNPDIFHSTLDKVGSSPRSGLHIGDNLLTDIAGAAGVGMSTGWIAGYDAREPVVQPDYTLNLISDLPEIVESWLRSGRTASN